MHLLGSLHFALTLLTTKSLKTLQFAISANAVLGVGTIMWKLLSMEGQDVFIPALAYHMENCDIQLFSPQSYLHVHGGHAHITGKNAHMTLPDGIIIDLPIDNDSNLPQLDATHTTGKNERNHIGPYFMSAHIGARNRLQLHWIGASRCATA